MTALTIPADILASIKSHCAAAYPEEACGLLIGRGMTIEQAVRAENLSVSPKDSFEIDPALIVHWQKKLRQEPKERGTETRRILGHYHSHPDHPAEPSAQDRARIYEPDLIWGIVRVSGEGAETTRFFSAREGTFQPLDVIVR
tara:strand:- start:2836 stop:3264 length:429 start_codon:yes stop_codon:yes gene_type:complete